MQARGVTVRETVKANSVKFGKGDLKKLFAGAAGVTVAKGKKSVAVDPADGAALAELALGPTGNLRAPTVRVGKRWLVGFGEEAWGDLLG